MSVPGIPCMWSDMMKHSNDHCTMLGSAGSQAYSKSWNFFIQRQNPSVSSKENIQPWVFASYVIIPSQLKINRAYYLGRNPGMSENAPAWRKKKRRLQRSSKSERFLQRAFIHARACTLIQQVAAEKYPEISLWTSGLRVHCWRSFEIGTLWSLWFRILCTSTSWLFACVCLYCQELESTTLSPT